MLSTGGVQRAAEDARGAARPRRVRAGHHRPAEGAAHHPQPHPALRVPPARRRRALGACSRELNAEAGLGVDPTRPSTWSCAGQRFGPRRALGPRPGGGRRRGRGRAASVLDDIVEALMRPRRGPGPRRCGRRPRSAAATPAAGRGAVDHLRDGFLLVMAPSAPRCPATASAPRLEQQGRRLGPAGDRRAMEVAGRDAGGQMREALDPAGHPRGGARAAGQARGRRPRRPRPARRLEAARARPAGGGPAAAAAAEPAARASPAPTPAPAPAGARAGPRRTAPSRGRTRPGPRRGRRHADSPSPPPEGSAPPADVAVGRRSRRAHHGVGRRHPAVAVHAGSTVCSAAGGSSTVDDDAAVFALRRRQPRTAGRATTRPRSKARWPRTSAGPLTARA